MARIQDSFETISWRPRHTGRTQEPGEWGNTPIDDSTRLFIRLDKSFRSQLEGSNQYFSGQTEYMLSEKMKLSAEFLLSCSPDAISLQLTEDGSIYYTVRKDNMTIYLDHYLTDEFTGRDEAIVSIYKNNEKLLDFGASLDETIYEIDKVLAAESVYFSAFA